MSLPYTLSECQEEFYKDTCEIYRQVTPYAKDGGKELKRPVYSATALFTGIPFDLQATEFEAAARYPLGQTANENMFTRDKGYFHIKQDIKGMDLIRLTTVLPDGTDHPNKGDWYRVVGDAEVRYEEEEGMNYLFVRLEGVNAPSELAGVEE